MHRPPCAWRLSLTTHTWTWSSWTAHRSAIENRTPTLNATRSRSSGCSRWGRRRWRRCAVDRTGAGLRHDDPPRRRSRRSDGRGSFCSCRDMRKFFFWRWRRGRAGARRCSRNRNGCHWSSGNTGRRRGWRLRGCGRRRHHWTPLNRSTGRRRGRSRRNRGLDHHGPHRRPGGNRRGLGDGSCCHHTGTRRGHHHVGRLARQRNNLPWRRPGLHRSCGRSWNCTLAPCRCSRLGRDGSNGAHTGRTSGCRSTCCRDRRARRSRLRGRFALLLLENRLRDVPDVMHLGPVDFRLDLRLMTSCAAPATRPGDIGAHTLGFVRFDRTRMRLLLGNSDRRERVQNFSALYFQLTR